MNFIADDKVVIMHELDFFFNPSSIAVIGVSRNHEKIGSVIFQNILDSKYTGNVYAVNPNTNNIFERKCYPSVKDIEGDVDLAVIAIPAAGVLEALKDCIEKCVKACIVISAGFSEIGNKKVEEEMAKIAKDKIRIIGPNVIGLYDSYSDVDTVFNAKYRQGRPRKGGIAFVSQSGAFGSALMDWCVNEGVGLSKFISIGNRVDVDETDLLDYLADDDATKVIAMYLESTKNGRRFYEKLKSVTKKKPVIIMKAGKSAEGVKAAKSHTGSLAGSAEIYSGLFSQAGAIEAENTEDLFDFAKALALPRLRFNRVQIITNGGGFGVIAADAIIQNGLKLAEIGDVSKKAIKRVVPGFATVSNPIDLTGNSTSEMYENTMKIVLEDGNVGALIIILLLQVSSLESDVIESIIKMKKYGKPIVVCSTGSEFTDIHKKLLEESSVPVYPTPERAAKAIKALSRM